MRTFKAPAELVLVLVTIIAASGWILSKEAMVGMPPLYFLGTRFLLAGVVLLIFCYQQWHLLTEFKVALKVIALGLLMTLALLSWVLGLNQIEHLGEGAFINSLGIIFIPVIGRVLFAEKVSLAHWLSLPIAVAGLVFLSLESSFTLQSGQLYFFVSSILFALHFTLVSRLAAKVPASLIAGAQLTIVGIIGLILSALTEQWPLQLSGAVIGWFLASALIATSLRFSLQTYAQGLAPASHVALIMILEPVWAAIFASYWFAESMSLAQFFGCFLIFLAMIISRWQWCRKIISAMRANKAV
ncbi:MAG: DMT family transporter [Oceanospirillaceae bacterium]